MDIEYTALTANFSNSNMVLREIKCGDKDLGFVAHYRRHILGVNLQFAFRDGGSSGAIVPYESDSV